MAAANPGPHSDRLPGRSGARPTRRRWSFTALQAPFERSRHLGVVGESKPDTDWLGNPKTVHTDAEGTRTGESVRDTDWLGTPMTVHKDADGNVIGESREETDILGNRQTVRYEK